MSTEARWNARIAAELDPVRRAERLGELRLAAGIALAPTYVLAEALLSGVPVPAERLDEHLVRELGLEGDVHLDDHVAIAVVARLPRKATT